jgi:hypothetical protein
MASCLRKLLCVPHLLFLELIAADCRPATIVQSTTASQCCAIHALTAAQATAYVAGYGHGNIRPAEASCDQSGNWTYSGLLGFFGWVAVMLCQVRFNFIILT